MQELLAGAEAKLGYAAEQLAALSSAVESWVADDTHLRLVGGFEDASSAWWSIRVAGVEELPLRWAAVAGSITNGFRSALDHAVYLLCFLDSGKANNNSGFPTCRSEADFDAKRVQGVTLKGLSVPSKSLVRSHQPFHADDPSSDPLFLLGQLSNDDKHRVLQPAHLIWTRSDIRFRPVNCQIDKLELVATLGTPFANGDELMRLRLAKIDGDPGVDVRGAGMGTICFRNGAPFLETLERIRDRVQSILQDVDKLLPDGATLPADVRFSRFVPTGQAADVRLYGRK